MTQRDSAVSDVDSVAVGRLDPATSIGTVALGVSDLERSRAFYVEVLGMTDLGAAADGSLWLGGPDGRGLLGLAGDPDATPRNPHETGLFHFAVLVPSRVDLARSLASIAAARIPLTGASDHLVSEALYLQDPDGNGIEIYRDRPREEWPHDVDGTIKMATLPLDLDDLLAELPSRPPERLSLAAATVIGHVHLQVASIPDVDAFYTGVLGFDATVRTYPGALFVSAGGYHHHIGLNTWNSRGGAMPGPRSVGLGWFEVRVGSRDGLEAALDRVRAAGLEVVDGSGGPSGSDGSSVSGGFLVTDPAGHRVLLSA